MESSNIQTMFGRTILQRHLIEPWENHPENMTATPGTDFRGLYTNAYEDPYHADPVKTRAFDEWQHRNAAIAYGSCGVRTPVYRYKNVDVPFDSVGPKVLGVIGDTVIIDMGLTGGDGTVGEVIEKPGGLLTYIPASRELLLGRNGGYDWRSLSMWDASRGQCNPWGWPQIHGSFVVGSRLYVACLPEFQAIVGGYTRADEHYTPSAPLRMWYTDLDLSQSSPPGSITTEWKETLTGLPCVANPWLDAWVAFDPENEQFPHLNHAWCSCIHKGLFWVFQGLSVKADAPVENIVSTVPTVVGTTNERYVHQAFCYWTMPLNWENRRGEERGFTYHGMVIPGGATAPWGRKHSSPELMDHGGLQVLPFSDHLLIGFTGHTYGLSTWAGVDIREGVADNLWRVDTAEDGGAVFSLASDSVVYSISDESGDTWTPRKSTPSTGALYMPGVCVHNGQVWVVGGANEAVKTPGGADTHTFRCNLRASIKTSVDGKNWFRCLENAPKYPALNFHLQTPASVIPQVAFFEGIEWPTGYPLEWGAGPIESRMLFGWPYYTSPWYEADPALHSARFIDTIWPIDLVYYAKMDVSKVYTETAWYNFPLGGEPGIDPAAPAPTPTEVKGFLRVGLDDGSVSVGAGYPFVSTLQNSSPTALPGQLPDKMLAGDANGYLNKALVREASGLGNPSKYVLWTLDSGSTATVLNVRLDKSILPTNFLVGLPVRILGANSSYVERVVASNTTSTITLTAALATVPAAGTQILIAPMICAALLGETRYQYPARLVTLRLNLANYQDVDQSIQVGVRTAQGPRRFGDFTEAPYRLQTVTQRQLEAGGGVVGVAPHASRSLTYDLRFIPVGGGDLEIGPISVTENIQPGEGGLS